MAATARSSSAQALAETFARAADCLTDPREGAAPEDGAGVPPLRLGAGDPFPLASCTHGVPGTSVFPTM